MVRSALTVNRLKPNDFSVSGDYSSVTVRSGKCDIYIAINGCSNPVNSHVVAIQSVLAAWEAEKQLFASNIEKFFQRFLKGRKVAPSELMLFGLNLMVENGEACAATLQFRVAGDYSEKHYKLDEFDQRSVIEIDFPIESCLPDFTQMHVSSTNDFDR